MKILHVNKFLYRRGGAEAYMLDVAELQRRSGHEVEFFANRHPSNDPARYADDFPEYIELGSAGRPTLRDRVVAAGRLVYSQDAATAMDRVLASFRPDVVHLHNIYHQLSPSILRPIVKRGVAVVMTLHDYKLACPNYQFLDHGHLCEACIGGAFHNAVLRRCKDDSLSSSMLVALESFAHRLTRAYGGVDRFICPSRFLMGKMETARVFPSRLRHLEHFVQPPADASARLPSRRGGFLFAGRLSHEKGLDVLIKAAAEVASVQVDIAGDGPVRAALEELAAAVAPGRVRFHGRVSKERVAELMSAARAVVLPARWYENQPVMVLEAIAQGVPVVASNLGGLPELVDDGRTGLIVPADDPAALAAALQRLHVDGQLVDNFGREARRSGRIRFAPDAHLARLMAIYGEAADAHKVALSA